MTETHHPTRRLWCMRHGERHHGVVAAESESQAWLIVQTLRRSGDVPDTATLSLAPSPRGVAAKVREAARRAQVGEHFLACLGEGLFIIQFCGGRP